MSDASGLPEDAARYAALGAKVDFRECVPCGGSCCKMPWTVFVTPRDLRRLEALTGRRTREFVDVKPLPEWERDAYGEANLLFSRVVADDGSVPQLKKREDGSCVFLNEQGLCGVHAGKPLMCRLFPFYYDVHAGGAQPGAGEARSPLGTARADADGRTWFLLVDRGHLGNCPITTKRMAEVEGEASDALLELMRAFEQDVARYEAERNAFVSNWRKAEKRGETQP